MRPLSRVTSFLLQVPDPPHVSDPGPASSTEAASPLPTTPVCFPEASRTAARRGRGVNLGEARHLVGVSPSLCRIPLTPP